jgi:hypothetical protein
MLIGGFGCPENKADPEEAFKKFVADVHARRSEAVWNELTASTRAELTRRHKEIRASTKRDGGAEGDVAAAILFDELGLMVLNQPESIAIVSPPGQEVMLRVSVKDGRSADVKMVREDQTWKVDLLRSLSPAPPLDQGLQGKPPVDTSTVP